MQRFFSTCWLGVLVALLLSGCASKDIPVFTPPAERAVENVDKPWPNGLLTLAYHDVEDSNPDSAFLGVRSDHLVEQLAWLRESGYQAVSIDQILAARDGGAPLPPRAVLLSFDDGYRSFYTRVFPILKAYGWPFVIAPVGVWLDTPADQKVNFGGRMVERERFMTWEQVREMARSPLVEVGAHTNDLHYGTRSNPQGNQQPAAATWAYDEKSGTYETEAAYESRLRGDMQAISEKVRAATGKSPRVWVWPYGAASGTALRIVGEQGYSMALTLESGLGAVDRLMNTPRVLPSDLPTRGFAGLAFRTESRSLMRVAHVDMDYVYDPDPAQTDINLGKLVQRIHDLGISTVFLQAYADPEGDGLVRSVYFPNRWLPMRADLFNRVAWQLRNRTGVEVYAWMPVLSYDLDAALPRVTRAGQGATATGIDPNQYRRLSPFDAQVRKRIGDIYEDLARQASFTGILFHDDALLSDFEDVSEPALAAYRAAGLPGSIDELRADAATLQRWTRFKSRYLVDFTHELTQRVRAVRGPQVTTARNIFAMPILKPESEAWFAQNLDDFLDAYDWTAPMAMPLMEGVPPAQAHAWLDGLVDAVARRPGALDRTVFELQTKDWNVRDGHPIDSHAIAGWMRRLKLRGARSFGYYPDDFSRNEPKLEVIRPALSKAWFPYHD
jgi:biofilm PGA synthesis lipoprotein PgaB